MLGVLLCAAAVSACSTLRVAYDNGPTLAWWWIDGYADFSGAEASRVKDDIRSWFGWHRKAQLPAYADWLASTRQQIGDSITPAQVCRLLDDGRRLLDPALDKALRAAAAWVPTLTEAQLRHLEQRYAKNISQLRADHLQPDLAKRHQAALKRTQERLETFYGDLDEAQRKLLSDAIQAAPLDAEAWLRERQRQQKDTLSTVRSLLAERAPPERVTHALQALAERNENSPLPAYRAHQQHLKDYNCATAARLHAATKPAQRQHLHERLAGWEADLRALAAEGGAAP